MALGAGVFVDAVDVLTVLLGLWGGAQWEGGERLWVGVGASVLLAIGGWGLWDVRGRRSGVVGKRE